MVKALLYCTPDSPPCHAVVLLIKQLKLDDISLKNIDLENNEHLTPQYLAINRQHQVPTLVDTDGFVVTDSHAITQYLANGTNLVSSDPHVAARINQIMFFDFELFRVISEIGIPLYYGTITEPSQKTLGILFEKLEVLEHFLSTRTWVAGDFLTIADFSVCATFSAIYNCPIDLNRFASTLKWFERCKRTFVGYAAIEQDSRNALGAFLRSKGIRLELLKK